MDPQENKLFRGAKRFYDKESILYALDRKGICYFELDEDKRRCHIAQPCDRPYRLSLSKSYMGELIEELKVIYDQMV